jgi:hypothetical protein
MEDVRIQFEGFSPPTFVKTYFRDLVEEVRNEAPTWATVQATVHRADKEFRGIIKITSHAGEFFAAATARRVTLLGHKLTQRIRRQLGKWKATRFSHETIRDPDKTPALARKADAT